MQASFKLTGTGLIPFSSADQAAFEQVLKQILVGLPKAPFEAV